MATAEIITIGTELLLGEIPDTNSQYLAKALNEEGFDVFRVTTIGDNVSRIASVIKEALGRSDLVITTGGLGPTIDDPTREAAALAFGVETVFHEELWQQITDRFQRFNRHPSQNNKRQAYLPANAIAIENPVGTAPAFYIHHVNSTLCCLPGVPSEMRHLFTSKVTPIIQRLHPTNAVLLTRTIHTIGIGESSIDSLIGELEKMQNPTIGLAAHLGQVDIRIAAKAQDEETAGRLIEPILQQIQAQVGDHIYGYDDTNIHQAIRELLHKIDTKVKIESNPQMPFLSEMETLLDWDCSRKEQKNQYNNKKQGLLMIHTDFDKSSLPHTLSIRMVDNNQKPSMYRYSFIHDPSVFEEWVTSRLLGAIFHYLNSKGE